MEYSGPNTHQSAFQAAVTGGKLAIMPCKIHIIAPSILKESQTLLEQRNSLLKQLGSLKRAISAKQRVIPDGTKSSLVESELKKAHWIRKTAKEAP
jgi:hypothetical protein